MTREEKEKTAMAGGKEGEEVTGMFVDGGEIRLRQGRRERRAYGHGAVGFTVGGIFLFYATSSIRVTRC